MTTKQLPGLQAPDGSFYVTITDGIGNLLNTKTVLTAPTNFYVNASTGNDLNTGLTSSTPFLTLGGAIANVIQKYDFGGQNVQINVANGTYSGFTTEAGVILSMNWSGGGALTLMGNPASPGSVIVDGGSAAAMLIATGPGPVALNGFHLQSTLNNGLTVGEHIVVSMSNIDFGNCGFSHIGCGSGADLIINGNYSITGTAQFHMQCTQGGSCIRTIGNVTCTIVNPITFAGPYFVYCAEASVLELPNMTFVNPGNVTATRYGVALNGVINTNSANPNYFPGTAAGVNASGGQYI